MDKDHIAKCLIIQYLEHCASNEKEIPAELSVAILCLKNSWDINYVDSHLYESFIDLIPSTLVNPELVAKLKNEGNKAIQNGNYELAIKFYTEAITLDPSSEILYSNRAMAYQKKKDYHKASSDAEKAIKLNPNYTKAYSRLGTALWSTGKMFEARDAFIRGLKVDPGDKILKEKLQQLEADKLYEYGQTSFDLKRKR